MFSVFSNGAFISAKTENEDQWSLSLVFYDSSVNGGLTPLNEVNWDASDGGHNYGETRVITMQIT